MKTKPVKKSPARKTGIEQVYAEVLETKKVAYASLVTSLAIAAFIIGLLLKYFTA